MERKIYVIPYGDGDAQTAWQKAPSDVQNFLSRQFNVECKYEFVKRGTVSSKGGIWGGRFRNVIERLAFYVKCLFSDFNIEKGAVFFMQHPYNWFVGGRGEPMLSFRLMKRLLHKRNAAFVFLIHDVNELRVTDNVQSERKITDAITENADYIIVHNKRMLQWFSDRGVPSNKLVSLEIFDYASKYDPIENIPFEKAVTVAGALSPEKAGYLRRAIEISGVDWHLYGKGFEDGKITASNIHYHGVFHSDEIPKHLKHGFGLIWDGDSLEGCTGVNGNYLRYNNPHKLSLYLSAGLPVIIWDEAAEADLVRENKLGFTIKSLQELPTLLSTMSQEDYANIHKNVLSFSRKIRDGYFINHAMQEVFDRRKESESTDLMR